MYTNSNVEEKLKNETHLVQVLTAEVNEKIPRAVAAKVVDPLSKLMQYGAISIQEKTLIHWDEIDFGAFTRPTQFNIAPVVNSISERLDDRTIDSPILEFRESSPCCCPFGKYCCGTDRQAKFVLYSHYSSPVLVKGWPALDTHPPLMIANKPYRCASLCCFYLCTDLSVMNTEIPTLPIDDRSKKLPTTVPTQNIGSVSAMWQYQSPCQLSFNIHDNTTHTRPYRISSPCCCGSCCINFCAPTCLNLSRNMSIINEHEEKVGEIKKQYTGLGKPPKYLVRFPQDSNSTERATILSAIMLINWNMLTKV